MLVIIGACKRCSCSPTSWRTKSDTTLSRMLSTHVLSSAVLLVPQKAQRFFFVPNDFPSVFVDPWMSDFIRSNFCCQITIPEPVSHVSHLQLCFSSTSWPVGGIPTSFVFFSKKIPSCEIFENNFVVLLCAVRNQRSNRRPCVATNTCNKLCIFNEVEQTSFLYRKKKKP